MHLITFEGIDAESRKAARVAIGQEFSGVTVLSKKGNNTARLREAPESIFIHGHSQRLIGRKERQYHSIQGLRVKDMVSRLCRLVPDKDSRKALKDIYILSCEAGWIMSDQSCYAKELADALHKAGFTALKVHAISSPDNRLDEHTGMRVELTTRAGVQGVKTGTHFGHVSARFTSTTSDAIEERIMALQTEKATLSQRIDGLVKDKKSKDTQELLDLFNQRKALNAQIYAAVRDLNREKQANCFMSEADLLKEMQRPENTFRHGKTTPAKEDLLLRVAEPRAIAASSTTVTVPVPQDDSARAAILADLEVLRDNEDNSGKFSRNVSLLLDIVSKNPEWKRDIFAAMDNYHKPARSTRPDKMVKNLSTNRDRSEFYGLLVHLVREYRLTRKDNYEPWRQQVEEKLRAKGVDFEHVMVNPGDKKLHVSVLSAGGTSEFKLKKEEVDESIAAWLKTSKPAMASSRSDETQAARSVPVEEPNLLDILVEKLIYHDINILVKPQAKGEQIDFELSIAGRNITATLSRNAYEQQLEHLDRVLGHLENQGISYPSLSFVAGQQGYQIKIGNQDALILTERNLENDMHRLIKAPPVPIVRIREPASSSSDSETNVSHSDEDTDDGLLKNDDREQQERFPNRYAYGLNGDKRSTHFWNKASARGVNFEYLILSDAEKRTLVGDLLKRAILDAFQRELNRYSDPRDLEQVKARMKKSPDYAVLEASQGFTTSVLRFFKNTDSVNAFNYMTRDIREEEVDRRWQPHNSDGYQVN
ncbi:hypothetical protein [Legionella sp. CNM-4043-24]|uniref:hypothetical protein n=1 Tax=Legionella sp. CNM-4043-24 TaxID=3421646 RepID=UPI00403B1AB2